MRQIVLDAGPLISLFFKGDSAHTQCSNGFRQLVQLRTELLIPLPIVFEVYKWLLQKSGSNTAQIALSKLLESLQIISLDESAIYKIQNIVRSLPGWKGSLEDASVILVARRYRCPVWTLNYRDFGSIKGLQFWNPRAE